MYFSRFSSSILSFDGSMVKCMCMAIDRAITIMKGIRFDKKKSQRAAKFVIVILLLIVVGSCIRVLLLIHVYISFLWSICSQSHIKYYYHSEKISSTMYHSQSTALRRNFTRTMSAK